MKKFTMKDSNGKTISVGSILRNMKNQTVEVTGVGAFLCEVEDTSGVKYLIDECILDCVWEIVE